MRRGRESEREGKSERLRGREIEIYKEEKRERGRKRKSE